MGNWPSSLRTELDESALEFYQHIDDPCLGTISIFTSHKLPFNYILRLERYVRHSQIYNLFQRIEYEGNPHLLNLFAFHIQRRTSCDHCVHDEDHTVEYWEYLNFSFSIYLQHRQAKDSRLSEEEIWHIVQSCCSGYQTLARQGLLFQFEPGKMLITLQGKLKLVWAHLQLRNTHLSFFQHFGTDDNHQSNSWETSQAGDNNSDSIDHHQQIHNEMNNHKVQRSHRSKTEKCDQPIFSCLTQHYFSPEELNLIAQNELSLKLNMDKCNSFRLGMVLLYSLTLQNPLFSCYVGIPRKVDFRKVDSLLATLRNSSSYSSEILQMTTWLLDPTSNRRGSIAEVQKRYNKFFNKNYELIISHIPSKKQSGSNTLHQSLLSNNGYRHRQTRNSISLSKNKQRTTVPSKKKSAVSNHNPVLNIRQHPTLFAAHQVNSHDATYVSSHRGMQPMQPRKSNDDSDAKTIKIDYSLPKYSNNGI